MRIDHQVPGDQKTRMLRTLLRSPHADVYVFRLYCYATERGNWRWGRGEASPAALAAACEWDGDAGEFVQALRTSQWLAAQDDGTLELFGYREANAKALTARVNGASGGRPKASKRETQREPTGNPTVTQQEPNGNPNITQQEPTGNPTVTHGEPSTHEGPETQGKPNGNPTGTQREPTPPSPHVPPHTPPLIPTPVSDPQLTLSPIVPEVRQGKRPTFRPPTVAEVAAFCTERKNGVDAERFVAHYQSCGWVVGKDKPMRDWRAAVVSTWEHRAAGGEVRADEHKNYKP